MSERYSKLFALPENLYATGSPVVIAAGALLKDNQTGKVLAQLKLRNISKKTIKAATVFVEPLDTVGKPLGAPVTYQYLDLHADRDADFGQKAPIALPDSATRSFAVSVVQVIFADNSIWNDDSPAWKPLNRPKLLDVLGDSELAKQFRIEYGGGCENLLLEQKDLWHCACGAVNHQEEANCHKCGKSLSELRTIDMDNLRKAKEERTAKEKAEAEVARKKAEIAAAKAKKIGMISVVAVAILVIIVVAANTISGVVKKNNAYDNALALLENGQYEEAIRAFSMLGSYKDSGEKVQTAQNEQKYANAMALLDAGKYDEAVETFTELGNYKDSSECILRTNYEHAVALLENEDYSGAYALFEDLGNYKDAKSYFDRFQQVNLLISETSTNYAKEYEYQNGRLVEERIKAYGSTYFYDALLSKGNSAKAEYDSQGNMLTLYSFENGKEKSKYIYEYDIQGNMVAKHNYLYGVKQGTYTYEYDVNGWMIKHTYDGFSASSSHTWGSYEYDTNGNKIREQWYYVGEEDAYYSCQYEYDDNNQLTFLCAEYSDGSKYSCLYENKYDEQNRMIKQVITDSIWGVKTVVYKYDTEGNCSYVGKSQGDSLIHEYCYQYDADGNMIEETYKYYGIGEVEDSVTEYVYEYAVIYQPLG